MVLATSDAPATVQLEFSRTDGKNGCPETDRWDLTLTAHLQPVKPTDVVLEITLVPAPPQGNSEIFWSVPEHCRAHTTVIAKDQRLGTLGGFAHEQLRTEKTTLVVTPYIIWSDADMRDLLECKVKMAQKAHT